MTPADRAIAYVSLFVGAERAGKSWRDVVPVDAEILTENRVRIDGVEIWPGEDDTWFVKNGDKVTQWRPAAKP